jgi:hypothetical protein
MKLEERKKELLSILQYKGIEVVDSNIHKSLINYGDSNIYILSNFGNQITFNGSKKSINDIRTVSIEKIKYNSLRVDFFAVPAYGRGDNGKRAELCNEWCFIPSAQIYNSIKKYIDHEGSTWLSNPQKDWVGNISAHEFYWKSDAGSHREKIQWNNFNVLTSGKTHHDDLEDDINIINNDDSLSQTEKTVLIKARKGQGKYRESLIEYWGSCSITACKNTSLLRASHIKPWKISNNKERLDHFNGLLLTANFDLLFDQGFISFCNKGNIIIANALDQDTQNILGVSQNISIDLVEEHLSYLEFHRNEVFLKQS